MKNMKNILSHLRTLPSFKKLKHISSLTILKNSLPDSIKKHLVVVYIRNSNLVFVFSNPTINFEFQQKKEFIKSIIKRIEELNNISFGIDNIYSRCDNSYINKNKNIKKDTSKLKDIKYKEKSLGSFSNSFKNEEIREKFELIRKVIVKNDS
jgi:hypothetical protein